VTRILALYPATVAALLIVLPILAPRTGPLALANILSVHLALAALVLVPVAIARGGMALRSSLAILGVVAVLRFGGEWFSLPPSVDTSDSLLFASSWNLERGARSGAGAVEGIATLDSDVVALQELGPEHALAITDSASLTERFPERALYPDPDVFGMGLLSRWPIVRAEFAADPSLIEAVVDVGGRGITVITAHPLAGRISMVGPVPIALGSEGRDEALKRIRARIYAAIARGETVVVLGDFNVAPTEPAFGALVEGLRDAHADVGQGPGWTWRPSRFEGLGLGMLRIDLALSSPDLAPVSVVEHCGFPGDHCILEAWFSLESISGEGSGQLREQGQLQVRRRGHADVAIAPGRVDRARPQKHGTVRAHALGQAGRVVHIDRQPDLPSDPSPDLDRIDKAGLRLVDQLERGATAVEDHDLAIRRRPVRELWHPGGVTVEGHRGVMIGGRDRDAQLVHGADLRLPWMAAGDPRLERRGRTFGLDVLKRDKGAVDVVEPTRHRIRKAEAAGRCLVPGRRVDDATDAGGAGKCLADRARVAARHDDRAGQVERPETPARRPDRFDLPMRGRVGVASAGVDPGGDHVARATVRHDQAGERELAGGDVVGREADGGSQVLLDRCHRSSDLQR
jgi:hypothetical protein